MADFRNVPAEQKKEVGIKINELKQTALERINSLREQFETAEAQDDDLDLTRTAYPIELGTRHPLTIVKNEISTSSHAWASPLPTVLKLKTTCTCSQR